MKEFHREDFANRTGLAQAWTVKSADRLFTRVLFPPSVRLPANPDWETQRGTYH